jgi:hypothetical protein
MASSPTFAVETNFLLERAHNFAGTEWESLSAKNGVITSTVLAELEFLCTGRDAYAKDAAQRVCKNHSDWGISPVHLDDAGAEQAEKIADLIVEYGALQGNAAAKIAALIIAEAVVLGCEYILVDRHAIIEGDENLIRRAISECGFNPIEVRY